MMRRLTVPGILIAVAVLLSGCMPSFGPQGGTYADYMVIVESSNTVLTDAQARMPAGVIDREEWIAEDLEEDFHRMSCSDTTSQYVNGINQWLVPATDVTALVERMRDAYAADGWQILLGDGPEPESVSLRSPDDFGLSLRPGADTDGTPMLQLAVFSPCIANPADKPTTWGR